MMDTPSRDLRLGPTGEPFIDALGRPLRDLRISVTDRCNFRCVYCMPEEMFGSGHRFLERERLLTFEEIARVARLLSGRGVEKIRITGGEPLLRRGLPSLVGLLSTLRGADGHPLDVGLTTNGSLLEQQAPLLREAGLERITISLDSLDDRVFGDMNGRGFPVARVLGGIEAALRAGFRPIKLNMLVRRGVNETSILPLADYARQRGLVLRFIEYMDAGTANGWRLDDVMPADEILALVDRNRPLEPIEPVHPGEVATRYRYRDGGGEIGIIASVSQPFCATCSRLRLTADGRLFTCLFGARGLDLRELLRGDVSDAGSLARIEALWRARDDRYSAQRSATSGRTSGSPAAERSEMFMIGG